MDEFVDNALAHGDTLVRDTMDANGMYNKQVTDTDGYVWEFVCMCMPEEPQPNT